MMGREISFDVTVQGSVQERMFEQCISPKEIYQISSKMWLKQCYRKSESFKR